MTRLLITGASGFIGRAAVAALVQDRRALRAVVRRAPPSPFLSGVETVQDVDLSRPVDWAPLLAGIDQVVHLAGIAHTGGVAPELYDRVNRQATADLATAAARAGVRQLVFISSIRAQCGASADGAVTERDAAAPSDAYGRSKLAAEEAVRASGVPFTTLRPVVVYGPGVKGNFALLLRAARSRWPLPVSDFINRRSLLGIDNFISALRFVLSAPAAIGETYIVADPGIPPRLADVLATLRTALGRRPYIMPFPTSYFEIPLRLLHRDDLWERLGGNLRADPAKLMAAGWQPAHDTRGGLAALAQAGLRAASTMPPATPTPKM